MRFTCPTRSLTALRYYSHYYYFHGYSSRPFASPETISQISLCAHFRKWNRPSGRSSTMAGESESFSTAAAPTDDSVKFGFERAEMYQSNLAGTVDYYERHVFLCYKTHDSWPSRVEDSDSDPLPKLFASALKARKNDIKVKTRLTICEGGDSVGLSDGDVLIFPEMTKYRGLKDSDVNAFVEEVLVNGNSWVSGVKEDLTGSFVFVCAHNNRDRRCGVCGPVLIEKFDELIVSKDLKNQVFVTACSHVGGHKYAGNVIIFSRNSEGKIAGNWYGYVTPNDVPELLDHQIGEGHIIERIWRGQMGAEVNETGKTDEPKTANGTIVNDHNNKPQEIINKNKQESTVICCQGANGFTCCREVSSEEKPAKKGLGGFSCWTRKWEQREVFPTVTVAGALTAVAVGYGLYRRSR